MDDEYFGRVAEESTEPASAEDFAAPMDARLDDIAPDPATAYLTLAAIEQRTGIKYVSLLRYAQRFGDRLPHEGTDRNRRYYPAAVKEFEKIKAEMSERRIGGAEATATLAKGTDAKAVVARKPPVQRSGKKKNTARKTKRKSVTAQSQREYRPLADPKPAAAPAAPRAAASDLDGLARIYQLRLQLKTLDEVAKFVAEWRTRVENEIEGLERGW